MHRACGACTAGSMASSLHAPCDRLVARAAHRGRSGAVLRTGGGAARRSASRGVRARGDGARTAARRFLACRERTAKLPGPLRRFGLSTLGEVVRLGRGPLGERFGASGIHAHELASGLDTPLVPREPGSDLRERFDLPESLSGELLDRVLGLLLDRLLARPERQGRTLRTVVLEAALVEGGTWRTRIVLREATADRTRLHLALAPHLAQLSAPAQTLGVHAESFGGPPSQAIPLLEDDEARRRARLREGLRQVSAGSGEDALLRIVEVDPRLACQSDGWRSRRGNHEPDCATAAGRSRPGSRARRAQRLSRLVEGARIEAVRESWLVEDRWWSPSPVRRRYWEVVTRTGQNLVLFRDLRTGQWFRQTRDGVKAVGGLACDLVAVPAQFRHEAVLIGALRRVTLAAWQGATTPGRQRSSMLDSSRWSRSSCSLPDHRGGGGARARQPHHDGNAASTLHGHRSILPDARARTLPAAPHRSHALYARQHRLAPLGDDRALAIERRSDGRYVVSLVEGVGVGVGGCARDAPRRRGLRGCPALRPCRS